ncbi:transcription factor MYB8-like [Gossypium arboreum]|uniref:Transcription repressor MYB5-like n=1 Tax=Gossypium arboreum TaxID=29729 RepID=A0ABR0MEN1_GOSAR|nr:transcription factor MYB8-like [Gossypium arboreum]KAK5771721.1 hypothetical protein PVK06_047961 [Gossypium arboreum]
MKKPILLGTSTVTSRTPCCSKVGIKKGPWTAEEDEVLANYIKIEGGGRWRTLPKRAGLLSCGKSCRLRWMNYLRPTVKRGPIAPDEEDLILRLHRLVGNRWALIAGRIPGRTDNEIKNYWNTHLSKNLISQGIDPRTHKPLNPVSHGSSQANQDDDDDVPESNPNPPSSSKSSELMGEKTNSMATTNLESHQIYQHQQEVGDDCMGQPSSSGNGGDLVENGNEDHMFSLFLDSLITDNQQQQQQSNNGDLWEAEIMSPMVEFGNPQNYFNHHQQHP